MARRKRKHIPIIEKLASALADFLPASERDALRAAKVPARKIVSMFTPDHNILHAWDGPDKWWNLTMKRRGLELKAKDSADTSRAAKAVRISEDHEDFRRRLLGPVKVRRRKNARRSPGGIARHVDPWGKRFRKKAPVRNPRLAR